MEREAGEEDEECRYGEGEVLGDEFEGDDVKVVGVLGVADDEGVDVVRRDIALQVGRRQVDVGGGAVPGPEQRVGIAAGRRAIAVTDGIAAEYADGA